MGIVNTITVMGVSELHKACVGVRTSAKGNVDEGEAVEEEEVEGDTLLLLLLAVVACACAAVMAAVMDSVTC